MGVIVPDEAWEIFNDKEFRDEPEARCPRCGETAANHGNYATGEDWTCPDQDGYGKRSGSDHN